MKTVLLIDARPLHVTAGPLPSPYGLEIIKACISDLDVEVEIFNPFLFDDIAYAIRSVTAEKPLLLIGISIRNIDDCITIFNRFDRRSNNQIHFFLDKIKDMVTQLKSITSNRIPIVVGGGGYSAAPEQILSYLNLEYGVAGPGENTFRQAAIAAIKGEFDSCFKKLPGAVVRQGDYSISNPNTYRLSEEKSMPIEREQFYLKFMRTLPLRIGTGCPLRCRHCIEPNFSPVSLRPIENVISELKKARADYPSIRRVMFADSELNLIREDYLVELFRRLVAEKLHLGLSFTAYFSILPFSHELLKYLKKLNFTVALTMDHVDNQILKNIGKKFDRADIQSTFKLLNQYSIRYTASIIFGHPEETVQSISDSLAFLETLPNAEKNILFTSPGIRIYPNTPLARKISPADKDLYGETTNNFVTPTVYCKPFDPMTMANYLNDINNKRLKLILMADLPFLDTSEKCIDVTEMFDNSIRGLHCMFNNKNNDALKFFERILTSRTKHSNPMFKQILNYMLVQYTKTLQFSKISGVLGNYLSLAFQRLALLKNNLSSGR